MVSRQQTLLYFGDQTDSWADGIDRLYRQAAKSTWLQSFLDDLTRVFKEEAKGMDRVLHDSLGDYYSLLELADRYCHTTDEMGMAHAMLLHALRAATLLQWVKQEPQLVDMTKSRPEALGISGGLTNLSALAIAKDFESLYEAALEGARVFARLCRLTLVRSRAIEDCRAGSWGWAVLGILPDELRIVLDEFQQRMGIPSNKRVKVGVTGDRWSTVIGPPSVLELFFNQCPTVKNLPKNSLNIHALQHHVKVSSADIDYIVGNSILLETPVLHKFRMWGMDDPEATYSNWGDLLRAVLFQVLSLPLDITKVMGQLNAKLGPQRYDLRVIGPSSHTMYIAGALKAAGSAVSLQYEEALKEVQSPDLDRIAIVGMAGRGPGSDNLEEFWDIIMSKKDLCEEIPNDRFGIKEFYCPEHGDKCTTTTKFGCFMKKPGNFDSRFFHVSPREALYMDPGHRQFLMSTYEALEMAGYSDGQTRTTDPRRIAAFYGQSNDDWHMVSHYTLGCDAYTLQGAQRAFGAGRIAYHFKWEGPTYSLDSACASSTSATHLASMSLLSKDIDMAVVGAANILGYPHSWTSLSKSGVLSDTGNCKTYRADADGYCRGDFVGTVVLKRLKDAVSHNDNILAVLAGSGRNHSGNATSITTSDTGAQARLFHKVMRSARISPDDVSYVEMHGTGTQTGDPAEMKAVANVFKHRRGDNPLTIGGVKANVGHGEAASNADIDSLPAAGMASLLKCIMMFQKNIMPPQVGMPHALNSRYPSLSELNIEIPSTPKLFKPVDQRPRRVLLNNFDAAGGNACMLLEDYTTTGDKMDDPRPSHVVAISAKTKASYYANKRGLLGWLRANPATKLADVAYTTTARRVHHPLRFACSASTTQDLITKLETDREDVASLRASSSVFIFTGQGSQYAGMGSGLYTTCPIFRQTVDLCASICEEHKFPTFLDIITNDDVDVSTKTTIQIQLAVVTVEIGLAAFWRSAGIQPTAVVGHSLGEYAALQVAGVLSLADMLYLVGHRAHLLLERCEANSCSMLSISSPAAAVQDILDAMPHSSCEIACINSPCATVVSGSTGDIAELRRASTSHTATLSVPYGFHSFQMDPLADDFTSLAGGVTYSVPKVPVASTLLASMVETSGVFDGLYLGRQTRQPANFLGALNVVKEKLGDPIWLEIGPKQVCGSFIRATHSPSPDKIMSTLEAGTNEWVSISKCLSGMYRHGIGVDWLAYHAPFTDSLKLLTLPSYAWDLKDFWIVYTESKEEIGLSAPLKVSEPRISTCAQYVVHESSSVNIEVTLGASIADPEFSSLVDGHRMRGVSVCPGSVFCEAALIAAQYALRHGGRKDAKNIRLALRHVTLKRPLTKKLVGAEGKLLTTVVMEDPTSDHIQVSWQASSEKSILDLGSCTVNIFEADSLQTDWNRISYFVESRMNELTRDVRKGEGHRMLPGILYALFASTVEYDPKFKCIKEAFVATNFEEATAEVVLQADPPGTQFGASPYWGESLVQLAGFLANANPDRPAAKTVFMMDSFENFEQTVDLESGRSYFVYARVTQKAKDNTHCDVYVFDAGKLVLQCAGLRFHEVDKDVLDRLLGKSAYQSEQGQQIHGIPANTLVSGPGEYTTKAHKQVRVEPKASSRDGMDAPEEVLRVFDSQDVEHVDPNTDVFVIILKSIAKGTGTKVSDFTDDMGLIELGVDSIMGIEIAARASSDTGLEILPSFMVEYPTIGDLRRAFGRPITSTLHSEPASEFCIVSGTPDSTEGQESSSDSEDVVMVQSLAEDTSPTPSARITLMQGRRSSGKAPFYIIADGTGSVATYLHLSPFKSKMPVYGIDSPYLRCPSRLTAEVGIPGVASLIVEALIRVQSAGSFSIGGFSGGAMLGYEVCRQLVAAGRVVDRLLLIDMCCPRPVGCEDNAEVGWRIYESIASADGRWNASDATQQHLRAIFAAVASYHPPPMTAAERPRRTAIIWGRKGLIDRCSGDMELMQLLAERDIPGEPFAGFMEHAKMGAIAWGLPHKTDADLGPNGWDRYVGETLCLAIEADHLEMPMPGHVHLLHGAMEEAFTYMTGPDDQS